MRAPARQYKLSCGGEQYSAHTSGALRYFTFGGSGCAESRTTRVYSLSLEKAQALYLSSSSQKLKKTNTLKICLLPIYIGALIRR